MYPNDFFAAAMATAGIVLFAKFMSHSPKQGKRKSEKPEGWWKTLHIICVGTAFLGLLLSLIALGGLRLAMNEPWLKAYEDHFLAAVFLMVVVASVILSFDVSVPREE
jgi:hypothetical protein